MENRKEIEKLYENYVSPNILPTDKYKKIKNEFIKSMENLEKKVDENIMREIEDVCEKMRELQEEQSKQMFEEGYKLGVNLIIEAIGKK